MMCNTMLKLKRLITPYSSVLYYTLPISNIHAGFLLVMQEIRDDAQCQENSKTHIKEENYTLPMKLQYLFFSVHLH